MFIAYSFGYKLGRGNWTSFLFKLHDPDSLWTIHVTRYLCTLLLSALFHGSLISSATIFWVIIPSLSCFLQNQLCSLLCMVLYPQRSEVCHSFLANLARSHHHVFQRSQSVSRWLALLWIHNKPRYLTRSHLAPGGKMTGVTFWDQHTVLLWVNPGQHRVTQPPSSCGMGQTIRMIKVRKLLGWDKNSLTWKAKAVCTSKVKQGSHPLFPINT